MRWVRGAYEVDTDCARLDMRLVCKALKTTYWGKSRTPAAMRKGFAHSRVVFGIYARKEGGALVGFARVVTDTSTFAWLADVFVDPARRGEGLGKFLIQCVRKHPDCRNVYRFMLATRDAHGLYEQNGWSPITDPETYMVLAKPDWWNTPQTGLENRKRSQKPLAGSQKF